MYMARESLSLTHVYDWILPHITNHGLKTGKIFATKEKKDIFVLVLNW